MSLRAMIGFALVLIGSTAGPGAALAQDDRLHKIEQRLDALEKQLAANHGSFDSIDRRFLAAIPVLAIGLFCGLWARNNGRDFWLWAVGGTIFTVFALIFLAAAIGDDKAAAKRAAAEKPSKEMLDV
jgi:hypothetical protein